MAYTLLNAYGRPYAAATPAATPVVSFVPGGRVLSYGPVTAPAPATRRALPPAGYVLTPVGPNPKRPGTAAYAATALYYAPGGVTVGAYMAAAGPRGAANLLYDLARGYVTAAPA